MEYKIKLYIKYEIVGVFLLGLYKVSLCYLYFQLLLWFFYYIYKLL